MLYPSVFQFKDKQTSLLYAYFIDDDNQKEYIDKFSNLSECNASAWADNQKEYIDKFPNLSE